MQQFLFLLLSHYLFVFQDLTIHRDEIHAKLVSIMQDRLAANIQQLPAQTSAWSTGPAEPAPLPASAFALTNVKQLQILSSVLSPLLLPWEVHKIFTHVGGLFSVSLANAFRNLESKGPGWEQQLKADLYYLLMCLRELPIDPEEKDSALQHLMELYQERFERPAQQQQQQESEVDDAQEAAEGGRHADDGGHEELPPAAEETEEAPEQQDVPQDYLPGVAKERSSEFAEIEL